MAWRRAHLRALLAVTGLAVGTGALLGALFGVAFATYIYLDERSWRGLAGLPALCALVGAGLGLVLGPVTAFGFLRAVPLGRAMLATAAGTVVGVAAAVVWQIHYLVTIPAGFVAGALYARIRHARPTAAGAGATDDAGAPAGAPPLDGD